MIKFISSLLLIFGIDRILKIIFLNGFQWHSKCISFTLAINKGVAFSLLSFLGDSLKYLQLIIVLVLFYFFIKEKLISKHPITSGILFGAAIGNLADRFLVGGVVDYVYWHCIFDFAIFNFADVMIDLSLLIFGYYYFFDKIFKKVA